MDMTNRDDLYNAIRATGTNKQLHALCATIAREVNRLEKHRDKTIEKEKEVGLNQLTIDSTDSELRAGVRALLINKVNDNSLTASEIGQFKDVFGLANEKDDLLIEAVDYSGACTCAEAHVCPSKG